MSDHTSILDDHAAQHPRTWRDLFRRYRRPSALELAVAALEECRRDSLDQAQRAEFHAAMVRMLREREVRLMKEVARLSSSKAQPLRGKTQDDPAGPQ